MFTQLGVYDENSDYVCGDKGGVYACRPMGSAVLSKFKELQRQINGLIYLKKQKGQGAPAYLRVDGAIGNVTFKAAKKVMPAMYPFTYISSAHDLARWASEFVSAAKPLTRNVPSKYKQGLTAGSSYISPNTGGEIDIGGGGFLGIGITTWLIAAGVVGGAYWWSKKRR